MCQESGTSVSVCLGDAIGGLGLFEVESCDSHLVLLRRGGSERAQGP